MKVVRLLNQDETKLLSDLLNQRIIRELVLSERSITDLANRLDTPTLKVWRRMQKLEELGLIELSRTQKSGNIETKKYRASATGFVPQQFLDFKPKDDRLRQAFATYSQIHAAVTDLISSANEIPAETDPVDYSFYASMKSFAEVLTRPENQEKLTRLQKQLSDFKVGSQKTVARS